MKYPLSQGQNFWREVICFFLGHNWKIAETRRTQYWGMDIEDVPYAYRKSTGNYMFETISWWSNKCTRCRYKTRETFPSNVWYKTLWDAIRDAYWNFGWHFEYVMKDEEPYNKSIIKNRVAVLPIATLSAISQFFVHYHPNIPSLLFTGPADVRDGLFAWLEKV